MDLLLKNARIYTHESGIVEAGLAIERGRIFKVAKETNLPEASSKIDLKENLVLPGLIDPHVHLRDQQLSYKEDFLSGTSAAAAGGVTLVLDMPNNKPVTMSLEALKERMRLAEGKAVVDIAFFSAFPKDLAEVPSIVDQGAVGFKLYLSKKIGGLDIVNNEALLRGFDRLREMKVPVAVHAEDAQMLDNARREMERAGRKDLDAYLQVHSIGAEIKAIRRIVRLVKKSGVQAHFCHVSSASGLKAILDAKKAGLPITCEVTPHHLLLSSTDLRSHGTLTLMNPPLRTEENLATLWSAVEENLIDCIASDHAPHTKGEKKSETVWDVKPGIPGLETTLPLLLTQVNRGLLTISDLVTATSKRPAEIFNLKDRGKVEEGHSADLVVVDMAREHEIDASSFYTKAKYSPFDGWKVKGKLIKTFLNGQLIMDEGEIVASPGTGRAIRPTLDH